MDSPLLTALAVAYRHYDHPTTTESEQDAILASISKLHCGAEGEIAARILHHRNEARSHQLQLKGLLGGVR